jgi:hypothetical protein
MSARHSSSPGPSSSSGGGDMKPPSLVDMARRVLGRRPELFGPLDGAPGASSGSRLGPLRRSHSGNAAATPGSGSPSPKGVLRTSSQDVSMGAASSLRATSSLGATSSMQTASSAGGSGAVSGGLLHSEPSLNMGPALTRALSSAASLENWLGPGSIGPGSRTTSGSPRSMSAAAAAELQQHLARSSSNAGSPSSGQGMGRSGSLVFGLQGSPAASGGGGGGLDKQASFAGWPDVPPGLVTAAAAAGGGSFAWPQPPAMRTIAEDTLKLDIQVCMIHPHALFAACLKLSG